MAAVYRVKDSPLRPAAEWAIEDGALVRRGGPRGEVRWPLAELTRLTLGRQSNRYGPDVRTAQLRFGRRAAGFTSQGWKGVARPQDETPAFAAFVRALAAEAAQRAPKARFEVRGGPMAAQGLYWAAALLGAGIAAMLAMSFSAGMPAMGMDLSARLLFVLILLFAVAPWLPGRAARAFDPASPPQELLPG